MNKNNYLSAFNSIPDPVFVLESGIVIYMNAAAKLIAGDVLVGFPADMVLGERLAEIAEKKITSYQGEEELLGVKYQLECIFDEQVIFIFHGMDEHKMSVDEANALKYLCDSTLQSISGIIMMEELAENSTDDNLIKEMYHSNIVYNAHQVQSFTKQIRQYIDIKSSVNEPVMGSMNISDFCQKRVEAAKTALDIIGIPIKLEFPKEEMFAMVDKQKIDMAINGIIKNAAKYCDPETGIIVTLENAGANINIIVKSKAGGKYYENINQIFSLESQECSILLAREIAKFHGGNLMLDKNHSEWITVTFTLMKQQEIYKLKQPRIFKDNEYFDMLLSFSEIMDVAGFYRLYDKLKNKEN